MCLDMGGIYGVGGNSLLFQLMPHCLSLSCHAPPQKNLYGKLLVQVSYEEAEILCRCLGMGLGKAKPTAAELGKGCGGQQASHGYISCKRKTRGSVGLLLRIHVTKDMEDAEVLHVFFALVSIGKATLWDCWLLMPVGNAKAIKIKPWMKSLKVRNV